MNGFNIINGVSSILISAPHTQNHVRNGIEKSKELFTYEIAFSLSRRTNSYFIYKSEVDLDDPNYSDESPYRQELVNIVNKENIQYVIDIHGMKDCKYDIEIGTNNLWNINNNLLLYKYLTNFFKNTNFDVVFDKKFKASFCNNVSYVVHEKCDIPAIQIEISNSVRANKNRRNELIDKLEELINGLKMTSAYKIEKSLARVYNSSTKTIGIHSGRKGNIFENNSFINNSLSQLYSSDSFCVLVSDKYDKTNINYVSATLLNNIKDNSFFIKCLFRIIPARHLGNCRPLQKGVAI